MLQIKFDIQSTDRFSHLGGGAWLPEDAEWPKDSQTGEGLLPLFTLAQDFFPTPTISNGMCVTAFIPCRSNSGSVTTPISRSFAANDQRQYQTNTLASVVLLHKIGSQERRSPANSLYLPHCSMSTEPFSDALMQEENADEINGAEISKLFGRPAWLQDEVFPESKYEFCLQLLEADVARISPAHAGLFRDGTGYLFLDRNCKKYAEAREIGKFFVQFT
jgi:hypothetical protein